MKVHTDIEMFQVFYEKQIQGNRTENLKFFKKYHSFYFNGI